MTYAELYEIYTKVKWAAPGPFARIAAQLTLKAEFEKKMQLELDGLHKKIFPRRKKINHYALPEEMARQIQRKWGARAHAWHKCQIIWWGTVTAKLHALAQTIELVPTEEMIKIEEVSSSTYSTQTAPHHYARKSAERTMEQLQGAGFTAEVREHRPFKDSNLTYYQVWANALPWQLDVINRRTSLFDECVALWRKGVNPSVVYPMLDPDIHERSCDVAMGR